MLTVSAEMADTSKVGIGSLFVLSAAVCPVLAVLAPLGLVPLLLILTAATLVLTPHRKLWERLPTRLSLVLAAVVVWGIASSTWTYLPSVALYKSAQLAFLFLAAVVMIAAARALPDSAQMRIGQGLAFGFLAALALLLVERFFHVPVASYLTGITNDEVLLLKRYNRGMTVLAVLLWPATMGVWRRYGRVSAAIFTVATIGVLLVMESRAAMVAAIAGGAVFLLAAAGRRPAIAASTVAIILALVLPFALPAVTLRSDSDVVRKHFAEFQMMSALHRMNIWKFTAERIRDRPLLGWGLDYSRHLPGGKDETQYYGEQLPLHPHNATLQIHVELGAVGVFLAVGLLVLGMVYASHQPADSLAARVLLAVLVAILVIASISYGIWQSWWIASMALGGIFSEAIIRGRESRPSSTD